MARFLLSEEMCKCMGVNIYKTFILHMECVHIQCVCIYTHTYFHI
jgi:hypothetical protein